MAQEKDLYKILEVSKNASQDDIKASYKKLVRKYHPDLNKENKDAAEEKFKEVAVAYEVLSDDKKRALYDQYGLAGLQNNFDPNQSWGSSGMGGVDLSSIFEQFFGGQGGGAGGFRFDLGGNAGSRGGNPFGNSRSASPKGQDVEMPITVDFLTSVVGGKQEVRLPEGSVVDVSIPAGIQEGKKIRLSGKGNPSPYGGASGDLYLKIRVGSHPYFRREGQNILVELPVSIGEAFHGAKVDVPTLTGVISLTIPPHVQSGKKLRIRGKGIQGNSKEKEGDLIVQLKVVLPDDSSEELKQLIHMVEKFSPKDLRKEFQEAFHS